MKEFALRVSHSSLMSSDRMKPRSGDWAMTYLCRPRCREAAHWSYPQRHSCWVAMAWGCLASSGSAADAGSRAYSAAVP
uniref:Uncharacterized protein n=1 Tax=Timema poppense TaxID=170557 RepID=A0A7R9H2T0_TIMPO|nr:unnamed protein product [Timema poppensis]